MARKKKRQAEGAHSVVSGRDPVSFAFTMFFAMVMAPALHAGIWLGAFFLVSKATDDRGHGASVLAAVVANLIQLPLAAYLWKSGVSDDEEIEQGAGWFSKCLGVLLALLAVVGTGVIVLYLNE
jgi:hypothetical protein